MRLVLWFAVGLVMTSVDLLATDDAEIAPKLLARAQRDVLDGEHEDALQRYQTITKLYPRTTWAAEAWWQVARLQERLGDAQGAFDALQALIVGQPGHFERAHAEQFRLVRGILDVLAERERKGRLLAAKTKKMEEADREALAQMLRTICQNGPHSDIAAQAHFLLGLQMEREGELETALEQHEDFLELYPEHDLADDAACQTAYIRYKQWQAMKSGSPRLRAKAVDAFTWFLTRYPQSERASLAHTCIVDLRLSEQRELETLARYYEAQGKTEAAAIYRRELAEKFPAKGKL